MPEDVSPAEEESRPESGEQLERSLSALVTEHFVLQTMRSTISSESASRASIFLAAVSSSLVALGFASQNEAAFAWLAAPLLVVLLAIGELTFVRLVEVSIEDIDHLRSIFQIRRLYARLGPTAESYFAEPDVAAEDPWGPIVRMMAQRRRGQVWFTAASLIGAVNSTLLGTGVALLLRGAFEVGVPAAAVGGVAVGVAALGLHVRWQTVQYRRLWPE